MGYFDIKLIFGLGRWFTGLLQLLHRVKARGIGSLQSKYIEIIKSIQNNKITCSAHIYIYIYIRRAKLGQIQGGCRGPSKNRERGGCNNFLLFTR